MVISELARVGERLRERLSRDALPELAELTLPCERLAENSTCKRHTPSFAFLQGAAGAGTGGTVSASSLLSSSKSTS